MILFLEIFANVKRFGYYTLFRVYKLVKETKKILKVSAVSNLHDATSVP